LLVELRFRSEAAVVAAYLVVLLKQLGCKEACVFVAVQLCVRVLGQQRSSKIVAGSRCSFIIRCDDYSPAIDKAEVEQDVIGQGSLHPDKCYVRVYA